MISSINKILRTLGIALLSSVTTIIMIGGLAYAATGTKLMSNFLSSGVDFISFFSGAADGNIGIDAKSFYARTNGSWLGYPTDNRNYLRNDTFMSGTLYDENNSAYYVNPNGTSNLSYVGVGKVQVNDVVTAGAACTATGSVARNASGALLSCQQLKWGRATGNGEGIRGLMAQLHANKDLYCKGVASLGSTTRYSEAWAHVNFDGTVQMRLYIQWDSYSTDTGWVTASPSSSGNILPGYQVYIDSTFPGGIVTSPVPAAGLNPLTGLYARAGLLIQDCGSSWDW